MSLQFICGLDGAGKTMYAMRLLVEELRHGRRMVVTNIALRMDELNAYCQEGDVSARVRLLSDDEVGWFWRCRPDGWNMVVNKRRNRRGEEEEECDFTRCERGGEECLTSSLAGCLYFIDEIHVKFDAREWMKRSSEARRYITQHRKMGRDSDDVVAITQVIDQVDAAFRKMGKDFTYLTNLSERRVLGVRMPSRFLTATYLRPFSGVNDRPLMRSVFSLDAAGLARCYDTAAGVGVVGGRADIGKRRRGLPFIVLPAGLILLGLLVWGGVAGAARWGAGAGRRMLGGLQPTLVASNAVVRDTVVQLPVPGAHDAVTYIREDPNKGLAEAGTRITGIVVFPGGPVRVFLNDGRRFTSGDPKLTYVDTESCVYDGRTYRLPH